MLGLKVQVILDGGGFGKVGAIRQASTIDAIRNSSTDRWVNLFLLNSKQTQHDSHISTSKTIARPSGCFAKREGRTFNVKSTLYFV
jgi:hypothetical protein